MGEKIVVIESDEYRQTREALGKDPIIQRMAREIIEGEARFALGVGEALPFTLQHEDGSPTHEFMMAALHGYRDMGGEVGTHIGGPAEAILAYRAEIKRMADEALAGREAQDEGA